MKTFKEFMQEAQKKIQVAITSEQYNGKWATELEIEIPENFGRITTEVITKQRDIEATEQEDIKLFLPDIEKAIAKAGYPKKLKPTDIEIVHYGRSAVLYQKLKSM